MPVYPKAQAPFMGARCPDHMLSFAEAALRTDTREVTEGLYASAGMMGIHDLDMISEYRFDVLVGVDGLWLGFRRRFDLAGYLPELEAAGSTLPFLHVLRGRTLNARSSRTRALYISLQSIYPSVRWHMMLYYLESLDSLMKVIYDLWLAGLRPGHAQLKTLGGSSNESTSQEGKSSPL